nr:NADH dehydrogenase subunit 6 [Ceriodaphnia dubia]
MQSFFLIFGLGLILLFPLLNHPLSMGLSILLLTVIMAVTMGLMTSNLWLSYVLILVLLGGLLVIFVYVSLLAPNELFKFKLNYMSWLSILTLFFLSFVLNLGIEGNKLNGMFNCLNNLNKNELNWLSSLYSWDLSILTMFLILYLFLTLIVVVSITKNDYSSLRSSN